MPRFREDPALLSKSTLRSALVAHNVSLPPSKSRKEVYVELYAKHVDQRHAAEFSSDEEEDQARDVAEEEEEEAPQETETPDVTGLTDDDLKAALLKHGVKAGPIVASTRALYERKLCKLLQSDGQEDLEEEQYSDSEEEEDEESGSEEANKEPVEQSNQVQQQSSQVTSGSFSITEMVEEMENQRSLNLVTEAELNGRDVRSQSNRPDTPTTKTMMDQTIYYTPKMKPLKATFNDIFPDAVTTPTGIHATCRKPIKGAAGRPVQYEYPDTPVSPTTMQRREAERRLLPIQIQFLFFLFVTCVLYFIYVFA